MKIEAFNTLGEISHFAISGYFVISGFDITGVDCKYSTYSGVRIIGSRTLHEICLLIELVIGGTELTLNVTWDIKSLVNRTILYTVYSR